MANSFAPAGFAPVKYRNGNPWNGGANMYSIASTDTSAYYVGDPVTLSGTGDAFGIPGVAIGVAGSTWLGVIVAVGANAQGGPYVDPANLTLNSAPATKTQTYYVMVVDDPDVVFEVSEANSGGTALAVTNIGENINGIAVAPATGVRVSGWLIDNAAHDTTSTRNCKLLRLVQKADNAIGVGAKWEVTINNHAFSVGVTGV